MWLLDLRVDSLDAGIGNGSAKYKGNASGPNANHGSASASTSGS